MTVSSDVYIILFSFGETKNFCSTIVTRFVVGDLCKKRKAVYLKFCIGVFNQTLSIHAYFFEIEAQL